MSRIKKRKIFRALTAAVVEKQFIRADDGTPEGWHDDQSAALAAFEDKCYAVQEEVPEASEEVKPRRGRPRKVS